MKKLIAILLILSTLFSLSAETLTHPSLKYEYEEYTEEEFIKAAKLFVEIMRYCWL